jgi:hypothetical protein
MPRQQHVRRTGERTWDGPSMNGQVAGLRGARPPHPERAPKQSYRPKGSGAQPQAQSQIQPQATSHQNPEPQQQPSQHRDPQPQSSQHKDPQQPALQPKQTKPSGQKRYVPKAARSSPNVEP